MKKKWQLLNDFLNAGNRPNNVLSLCYNNSLLTDSADISNAFSDHFSKISCNSNPSHGIPRYERCAQSFFLRPTCASEIESIISSLKTTGPGLDGIYCKHIKLVSAILSPVLSHIFNLVFKTSIFPSQLKITKVIPIFKKGDPSLPENYRPIAILPFFDKILEKLIEVRLTN